MLHRHSIIPSAQNGLSPSHPGRAARRQLLAGLLAIGSLLPFAVPAVGEQVIPSGYLYDAAEGETEGITVCQLVLDMTDDSAVELVRFSAVVGVNRSEDVVFTAFRVGAGDLPVAADAEPALGELASAGYSAAGFNSAGLYQEADVDNSVWTWAEEPEAAAAFLDSIVMGGFEVIFIRATPDSHIRRYQMSAGPPPDVLAEFKDCIERLALEGFAAASAGGYPAD